MNVPLSWRHFFDLIGITAFVYLISDFVPLPGASGGSEGSFYILLRYFLKGATSATLLVWRFATYYAISSQSYKKNPYYELHSKISNKHFLCIKITSPFFTLYL